MLKLDNICKSFPSIFRQVLKGINLELNKGDFCILIGSNGSGKSTLIKSISGEYQLDSGSVILNNQDITYLPIHKRSKLISSVTQDITKGTIQEMTLLENLSLSRMRTGGASYNSCNSNMHPLLTHEISSIGLGLEQYMNNYMYTLSGGQRQVIATIMATISNPTLLLLDEHCSALDPKTQVALMQYTNKVITEKSITTLMITHNLSDAICYGNRLIMMHNGELVLDVSGKEKDSLTISQLLSLFHRYEDANLVNQDLLS